MSDWARITVNLAKDTAGKARQRASEEKRSVSSYLANLIEKDVRGEIPRLDETQLRQIAEKVHEIQQAEYGPAHAPGRPARKSGPAKGS